ncbi:rRNA methyltransferase 2, mitochondrial isoform X1 [Acanthochromis polyacanthus]|uniref:rRNA methyltransferase 2, mitochondrial isoform X1 n=1 Tax=Acanthochromis polyacanthus TaxID=80966 RepID=UPI00223430FD|nr:rRNA methyltransferase 2, mitochondrial isoform X1 [Acanthochromis polyacanthus]
MSLLCVQRRCFHSSVCLLKKQRSKTAAEQRWLLRQLRDPYVKASHAQNFRCRSAFKLLEMDDKFRLLQPGFSVVDCGAAPGAWSQVAVQRVNSAGTGERTGGCTKYQKKQTDYLTVDRSSVSVKVVDPALPRGTVVGIDLLNIPPLDGADFLSSQDVTDPSTHAKLLELLPNRQAHVILSDMAPNASGFRDMDHEKLITMCLSLIDLAEKVLQPQGSLLCKYWDGILTRTLQEKLSGVFGGVRTLKPQASRKDSAERYFLATMYRKPMK